MLLDIGWLLGVLTLGLLSPGPDFFLILKNSVRGSRAHGMATALGISAGLTVQVGAISLGLGALDDAHLRVVQLIGVALLAYIGVRAVLADPVVSGPDAAGAGPDRALRSGFLEGLVCNVTNPKAFVFFVSVFAQVITPAAPLAWRIALPVAIVLHGLVCWTLVVLAVQSSGIKRRIGRAQLWLPRAFGVALLVVAVGVLVDTFR